MIRICVPRRDRWLLLSLNLPLGSAPLGLCQSPVLAEFGRRHSCHGCNVVLARDVAKIQGRAIMLKQFGG
jgi:hypothetical protein